MLSRRNLLASGSLTLAALLVRLPVRAVAEESIQQVRELANRIRSLYPRFGQRVGNQAMPASWPHPRQRATETLLQVDGWLLPSSVATWVLKASERVPNEG